MERLGAVLMALTSVLGTVVIVKTIANVSSDAWTSIGVLASAFGLSVVALLLPTGIVHGWVAVFPGVLEVWNEEPTDHAATPRDFLSESAREMYHILGWAFLIGAVVMGIGSFVSRFF